MVQRAQPCRRRRRIRRARQVRLASTACRPSSTSPPTSARSSRSGRSAASSRRRSRRDPRTGPQGHLRLLRGPAHGQRPAAQRPRADARHQGRLPPLQDDARLRRRRARRAGTRTACPSRSRSRRSSASTARPRSRSTGSSPSSQKCIESVFRYTRGVGGAHRARSASGSTSTTRTSPTTRATSRACGGRSRELHKKGLLYRATGRLVVGAGRHGAQRRARSGRATRPSTTRACTSRFPLVDEPDTALARLDDDPVDPAVEHVRGRAARLRLRRRRRRGTATLHRRRGAAREALAKKLKRELPVERELKGAELVGIALPAAVRRSSRSEARGWRRSVGTGASSPPTSSRSTPAPASSTSRPPSARTTTTPTAAHRRREHGRRPALLRGEARRHLRRRDARATPAAG